MRIVVDGQFLQTKARNRGVGRYGISLLNALASNPKVQLVIVLQYNHSEYIRGELSSYLDEHLASYKLVEIKLDNFFFEFSDAMRKRNEDKWLQEVQKLDPDLYLIIDFFPRDWEATIWRHKGDFPVFGIVHDLIPAHPTSINSRSSHSNTIKRRLASIKNADLILGVSNFTVMEIERMLKRTENVRCIGGSGFYKLNDRNKTKSYTQRSGIICITGEQPHKNIELLFNSVQIYEARYGKRTKINVLGINKGYLLNYMKELAINLKIEVEFLPNLSDAELCKLLSNSKVLVNPSNQEGLCMPVFEAARFLTPSIVTGVSGMAELDTLGVATFPPNNAEALSHRIHTIIDHEKVWNEYSFNCMTINKRSWSSIAQRIYEYANEF